MDNKGSMGSVIASYRKKRQQSTILFVYGAAGILVLAGIALLVIWLSGPSKPLSSVFATSTPTPTKTFTPTATSVPSATPTITQTATASATATFASPFLYTVQQGDNLQVICDKHNLGTDCIELIVKYLNPYDAKSGNGIDPVSQVIYPGEQIWLPNPGMKAPTATPVPANVSRGTLIPYTVKPGDSLAAIASEFNSVVDEIVKLNKLPDANSIQAGQTIQIPVNLVTATATRPPTSTPRTPQPGFTPTAPPTATP